MTSAPSAIPSKMPSKIPSSTVPSAVPSITGSVVFIEMNTMVTSPLTEEELASVVTNAESSFDVHPGSVEADVSYDISGTVAMKTDGSDFSDEELTSALQNSIADALNVHPSDVDIVVNPKSGVVAYTISSANIEDAITLQDALQSGTASAVITEAVSNSIPSISNVT